ncbi:Ligand-binding domain of nuclear hormone receptor [Teladorsagia circumcincta]|uniref:Ligand-binding domain of nuclear hormone receptor n=1 Tax=Teladorsagia circumcincta TaxID=45464 RepID=A0A2G9UKK3_TELCI|nr:Ligand-binding domain of nuclear hormone receptor [Teladorsagia circumcincta]
MFGSSAKKLALIPRTVHHYEGDDSEDDENYDLPDIIFDQIRFTETNTKRQLTLTNLKAMWCRDVAHYLEWIAGVPELRLLDVHEKLKLVTRQLCKIICFMLSYWTYRQAHDGIVFGSGICFIPTEHQDETLKSFLDSLANVVQNNITSIFRKVAITREEYILMKLINLFDTQYVHFPPSDRNVVNAALRKYQAALVNHIKVSHPSFDYNAVAERISALFGVMPYLELAGQIDDIHWSVMTAHNDGNIRGRLTNEIHVQSTRIS